MPAYYKNTLRGFISENQKIINNDLISHYTRDGFYQLLGTQSKSWEDSLPIIYDALAELYHCDKSTGEWGLLLEYPLYRLRKRIDLMLISPNRLFIIELKVGATEVGSLDLRQAEEYALDLRDFHRASHDLPMSPILCCTNLKKNYTQTIPDYNLQVQPVCVTSRSNLAELILKINSQASNCFGGFIDWESWERASYEPVPTIIEAATTIFAGHSVEDITRSEAENLHSCSQEVVRLIHEARDMGKKRIIVVTGVPGAGKTLAGLHVVHQTKDESNSAGRVIYLSGNTPLVLVIREALAQDEYNRCKANGEKKTIGGIRHKLKSRIQHINDFLKQYYLHTLNEPPFENAIVFDEAQRAWDHKHGKDKFGRDASEPELIMNIMERHQNWAAIVCLVGGGQEINTGEAGISEWIDSLNRSFPDWHVHISPRLSDSEYVAGRAIYSLSSRENVFEDESLHLAVSMRSFRAENVSLLVKQLLDCKQLEASKTLAQVNSKYPIVLTRDLGKAKAWLKEQARGSERYGLVVSSQAQRLKPLAIDVRVSTNPIHWFLNGKEDVRSSYYLEDVATEFDIQGLELDWACVIWDGDFRYTPSGWKHFSFVGSKWNKIKKEERKIYLKNAYRVLLTRARQGMVIVVPSGEPTDPTRKLEFYNSTFEYLKSIGFAVI